MRKLKIETSICCRNCWVYG